MSRFIISVLDMVKLSEMEIKKDEIKFYTEGLFESKLILLHQRLTRNKET